MSCVSTGCALVLGQQPETYYWGDLYLIGNAWVFYCMQAANKGFAPQPVTGLDPNRPRIDVPAAVEVFERNGVFVFAFECGICNAALLQKMRYI